MKMTALEKAARKLTKEGFKFERIATLQDGKEIPVISVDTDYDGPYPTSEVFKMHDEVRQIASKLGLHADSRGWSKVAIWIW